ncbi:MAG: PqqD family peptide modification chaperone, partial [Ruminococcus sp.]
MVHQYKLNGYNIVLDVFSGSVHSVDEVAYDIISMYQNKTKDEIIEAITEKYSEVTKTDVEDCISDIEELIADGKLFTEDKYADLAFDFKKNNTVIKALCLHIAHTCNLNCEYCFASQGKYH